MINHISTVWDWYLKRSTWIKWALFVFVIVAIVLLAIFYFFFPNSNLNHGDEITKRVRLNLEKKYNEDLKETKKMDSDIATLIAEEEKERAELEIARTEIMEKGFAAHEAIDGANDFNSVDRALDGYIKRPGRDRKR